MGAWQTGGVGARWWPRGRAGMLKHSCVRVAMGPVRRERVAPPHNAAERAIRPSENGVSAIQWLTDASTLENAHVRPNRFAYYVLLYTYTRVQAPYWGHGPLPWRWRGRPTEMRGERRG
jgi:hypothetical protein